MTCHPWPGIFLESESMPRDNGAAGGIGLLLLMAAAFTVGFTYRMQDEPLWWFLGLAGGWLFFLGFAFNRLFVHSSDPRTNAIIRAVRVLKDQADYLYDEVSELQVSKLEGRPPVEPIPQPAKPRQGVGRRWLERFQSRDSGQDSGSGADARVSGTETGATGKPDRPRPPLKPAALSILDEAVEAGQLERFIRQDGSVAYRLPPIRQGVPHAGTVSWQSPNTRARNGLHLPVYDDESWASVPKGQRGGWPRVGGGSDTQGRAVARSPQAPADASPPAAERDRRTGGEGQVERMPTGLTGPTTPPLPAAQAVPPAIAADRLALCDFCGMDEKAHEEMWPSHAYYHVTEQEASAIREASALLEMRRFENGKDRNKKKQGFERI
jgi:hypothetical protein